MLRLCMQIQFLVPNGLNVLCLKQFLVKNSLGILNTEQSH